MIAALTEIEIKIIERIKQASDKNVFGYKIPVAGYYKGELDENVAFLIKNSSPAVWITQGEISLVEEYATSLELEAVFTLFLFVRNTKSEVAARHGTKQEVGMNKLISDMIILLNRQDLGLDLIEPLKFISGDAIHIGKISGHFVSIYGLKFKAVCKQTVFEDVLEPSNLTEFLTLATDWEVKNAKSKTLVKLPKTKGEK